MITLKTYMSHYCEIYINRNACGKNNNCESFSIEWENGGPLKINNLEILNYINEFLKNIPPSDLKNEVVIDFKDEFICMDNIRDIFHGRIDELIRDDSEWTIPKLGAFGNTNDPSKPHRIKFQELAAEYPDELEMNPTTTQWHKIKTGNYSFNPQHPQFMTLLDLKKYKYIIDLPGHSFSTKIFWMLFMKRPIFFIKTWMPFKWEEKLEPYVHYIPLDIPDFRGAKEKQKRLKDVSFEEILEKFHWAQANPQKCKEIVDNAYAFALENLTEEKLKKQFTKLITKKNSEK